MNPSWTLDHVAHAVRRLDDGIAWYRETLGLSLTLREAVEDASVEVAFLSAPGGGCIELIAPLAGDRTGKASSSQLEKFLDTRGEGLHHLCFRVPSLEEEIKRLTGQGVEFVSPIPRAGSRNTRIVFMKPRSGKGALIELCEDGARPAGLAGK